MGLRTVCGLTLRLYREVFCLIMENAFFQWKASFSIDDVY